MVRSIPWSSASLLQADGWIPLQHCRWVTPPINRMIIFINDHCIAGPPVIAPRASSLNGTDRRVTCTDNRATDKHPQLFPFNRQSLFGVISQKTKLFLHVFSGIRFYKSGTRLRHLSSDSRKKNRKVTQERWYTHQTEYKASWLSTKLICIWRPTFTNRSSVVDAVTVWPVFLGLVLSLGFRKRKFIKSYFPYKRNTD